MDGKPDCWQGAEPENEERYKGFRAGSRVRNAIMDVGKRGPDSFYHKSDTFAPDPRLYAVPDTGHCCAIEDWP